MWEFLALLAVVALIIGLARVFREVWVDYRAGRRSLATALAITCIVAGIPVVFAAMAFEERGPANVRVALQAVGIGLVIGGGVFGAAGLVLDRRLGTTGGTQTKDPDAQ
jgi:undecaprenyl pyrophosphate phosphatase UppP